MQSAPRLTVAVVALVRGGIALARWPLVVRGRPPDWSEVDYLARLQLAARRLGCAIEVELRCPRLRELVDLAGLSELLGQPDSDL